MRDYWKEVQVIIPSDLSPRQVGDHIEAQVRIIASEAGEFVEKIRVGVGTPHSQGWLKWTASYLPGPPAPFPAGQMTLPSA